MSAGIGPTGKGSQDFELNIASIIDCFTVLITFLLASASFLSIGIFDAGAAAGGAAAKDSKPPSVQISVELQADHQLVVKLTGKSSQTTHLNAKEGAYDLAGLKSRLSEIHLKYPDANALTLSGQNDVAYSDVIKTMEASRQVLPAVLLGGF